MIFFEATVISWTARQPKSITFSGCPSAEARAAADVAGVGRAGRIAAREAPSPSPRRRSCPLNAPLPTAWNFPFQSAAGIQTSILMSESLGRLQRRGDAAERRQGRECLTDRSARRSGRRERPGIDGARERDRRSRQAQRRQPLARRGRPERLVLRSGCLAVRGCLPGCRACQAGDEEQQQPAHRPSCTVS